MENSYNYGNDENNPRIRYQPVNGDQNTSRSKWYKRMSLETYRHNHMTTTIGTIIAQPYDNNN